MTPISEDFNNDFIDQKIQIGSIISIDISGIDHPKWNIILDITDDKLLVASVFINTEIKYYFINNPELVELQYEIKSNNIKFLDHDSFIDCSKVFESSYSYYKSTILKSGSVRKIGDLPENDLKNVVKLVRKSKNISVKTKKTFKRLFIP